MLQVFKILNFCKFCEKAGSWAEQKGSQISTSGKTGIVYPLTNLGGNLRTSNQHTNGFLPAVTHAVSLSTTQMKSFWGVGEFSYRRQGMMGCRRELVILWAQGIWGKKPLGERTLGHSIPPLFPLFTGYTFYLHFYSQSMKYMKTFTSNKVMKPKRLHSPFTHFIHNFPIKPSSSFQPTLLTFWLTLGHEHFPSWYGNTHHSQRDSSRAEALGHSQPKDVGGTEDLY